MGKKRRRRDSDSSSGESGSGTSGSEASSSGSSSEEEERPHKREKKEKKSKKEKKEKKEKKDGKEKKLKKEKSNKRKKDKSKKSGRDRDSDDARLQAAKDFLKQQLAGGGSAAPPAALVPASEAKQLPASQQISDDDYFLKGNEFMAWLQEYKQTLFNELSTEASRELFADFVKVWNSGRLPTKYYAGLVQAPVKRTSHQWSFKGGAGGTGAAKGMAAFLDDKTEKDSGNREAERLQRKRQAGAQRELLEELVPRATGRDKIAEERFARREEAKARGASPDRAFLPGGGDMMGGDDSFAAAKAREARHAEGQRSRQLLKHEDLAQRVAQAQAAEDEKMAQFRALLGQGPITIAKRQ